MNLCSLFPSVRAPSVFRSYRCVDGLFHYGNCEFLYRLINHLFGELKDRAKDDPSLLRLLVYLSSEDDVEIVLEHAPAHFYAIHVSKICCETYDRLTKDKVVCVYAHACVQCVCVCVCARVCSMYAYVLVNATCVCVCVCGV